MKAVRLEELKTSDRTCEEELTRLVWEVAAKDRAKAEALFLHGCQLIEDKQRKQGDQTDWQRRLPASDEGSR